MPDEEPSRDRVQDRATDRKHERAETTESVLRDVEDDLGDIEYPVTGEELSQEYAIESTDLPNETESLGSVFDRLATDEFESPAAVREAVYGELTGEAGDTNEANPERDLEGLDAEKSDRLTESGSDHA